MRLGNHGLMGAVLCSCLLLGGCGREEAEKEPVAPVEAEAKAPPVAAPANSGTVSSEELLASPGLIDERLRRTNPGFRGGFQIAVDPEVGLIGQVSNPALSDLSGLAGIPFNALDLRGTSVSDLSPLEGMPLVLLGLEQTRVTDLSPLAGMGLVKLYLNDTAVSDLRPLEGTPIQELMLAGAQVRDISPLNGMPLMMLWLNGNAVSDISALAGCPLQSLTLEGTRVDDLTPLAGVGSLKRLHIGGTPVTDLTPLKGLALDRLIFNPDRITAGMEVVREMDSLQELGKTLEGRMPPAIFWSRYDGAGAE
jgi:hypothetical protein